MQITSIKCPLCEEQKSFLEFWHKVMPDMNFHICSACIEKNEFSIQNCLKIGFKHGYKSALEDLKDTIEKLKD